MQRVEGVGGDAAEQRPGLVGAPAAGRHRRREQRRRAEAEQAGADGAGTCDDGSHQVVGEVVEPGGQTGEGPPPRGRRRARGPRRSSSTERHSSPASPESSGWAQSISGHRHRSPCRSRSSVRRYGEPTPIGWNAEQWSWSTPGTVSSLVRVPPPMCVGGFEHLDVDAVLGEPDGGGEPVGARRRRRRRWSSLGTRRCSRLGARGADRRRRSVAGGSR